MTIVHLVNRVSRITVNDSRIVVRNPEVSLLSQSRFDKDRDGIIDQSEAVAIYLTAGEPNLAGNALCMVDDKVLKAKASDVSRVPVIGFADSSKPRDRTTGVLTEGLIEPTRDKNLVPNLPVFLSASTPGNVTPDLPSLPGQYIQKVGMAKTSSTMLIEIEEAVLIS
jgi:hypothetical protein